MAGLRERGRRVDRGAGDGGAGDNDLAPAAVVGGDELDAGDGTALTQSAAPVDGGAIAGAVVGVLALVVVAVGVGGVVVVRRRRQRQELASRFVGVDAIEAKVGAPATFVHGACARSSSSSARTSKAPMRAPDEKPTFTRSESDMGFEI